MNDTDFEGTLVLEALAAIDEVESFFEAIDADDTERVVRLMKRAKLDARTIQIVLQKIAAGDGEH